MLCGIGAFNGTVRRGLGLGVGCGGNFGISSVSGDVDPMGSRWFLFRVLFFLLLSFSTTNTGISVFGCEMTTYESSSAILCFPSKAKRRTKTLSIGTRTALLECRIQLSV